MYVIDRLREYLRGQKCKQVTDNKTQFFLSPSEETPLTASGQASR